MSSGIVISSLRPEESHCPRRISPCKRERPATERRRRLPTAFLAGGLLAVALPFFATPLPDPEPRYDVEVGRSVMVPMRDGTRLSTDVYLPVGADRKLGAILIRLPYGKHRWYRPDRYKGAWIFAGQGFAVLVQEMRGTYQSEGRFRLNQDERPDPPRPSIRPSSGGRNSSTTGWFSRWDAATSTRR